MFRLWRCCEKKSINVVDVVADESRKSSSSPGSVAVPDTPAATNKDERTPWRYRLFGRPMKKQSVAASDVKTTNQKPKAKKPLWWCKKSRQVAPAPEDQSPKEQCPSPPHQDQVVEFKGEKKDKKVLIVVPKKTVRQQQVKCLGFPNPAQICYMNSCLQSLLTLENFVRAIRCQEQVWSLIPEAAIMRSFMNISGSHISSDARHKIQLLAAFKKAVSAWSQEFQDIHQKDAHEFLTAVLEQMRCLGSQLQLTAAGMGKTYSCPVEDNLVFKMNNTRTCKRCGSSSTRQEEFSNLSLDLAPGGGTVEQMLENYLMEMELEYNCECGATKSGLRSSFATLPKVLVLHLKRIRFTPSFQLQKIHDPIVLLRDLVVSFKQGGACYSLVSTISHIGFKAKSGHYICDGVDPDVGPEDPTDRWFTYNDAEVTETSGASVCDKREKTAYILFYKRHN